VELLLEHCQSGEKQESKLQKSLVDQNDKIVQRMRMVEGALVQLEVPTSIQPCAHSFSLLKKKTTPPPSPQLGWQLAGCTFFVLIGVTTLKRWVCGWFGVRTHNLSSETCYVHSASSEKDFLYIADGSYTLTSDSVTHPSRCT
jgi:hypothetical protein